MLLFHGRPWMPPLTGPDTIGLGTPWTPACPDPGTSNVEMPARIAAKVLSVRALRGIVFMAQALPDRGMQRSLGVLDLGSDLSCGGDSAWAGSFPRRKSTKFPASYLVETGRGFARGQPGCTSASTVEGCPDGTFCSADWALPGGSVPQLPQGSRVPLGFDAVRWVEVVSFLEDVEREIFEHTGKTLRDLGVVARVTEASEREQDGPVEGSQPLDIERRGLERIDEGLDTRRSQSHPRGRIALRRRRSFDVVS